MELCSKCLTQKAWFNLKVAFWSALARYLKDMSEAALKIRSEQSMPDIAEPSH